MELKTGGKKMNDGFMGLMKIPGEGGIKTKILHGPENDSNLLVLTRQAKAISRNVDNSIFKEKTGQFRLEQDSLKKSQEKYNFIINNLPVGVAITTPLGYLVEVNQALIRMFGHTSKEQMSKIYVPDLYYDRTDREQFLKAIETGVVRDFETKFKRKNGTIFWASISAIKIGWDLQTVQFLVVLNEITKRKKAEEKLLEIDRNKTEFVASVAHELKTPLTSIIGFSEALLADETMEEDTKREFLNIIYTESKRLSAMVDEVLNISRIEAGRVPYRLKKISLAPIFQEVIDSYRDELKKKELKISYRENGMIPFIIGDRNAVKQVVINLIGNSIKFTNMHGFIKINLKKENGYLCIDVEDTGIGIPKSDLPKIFDKFHRGRNHQEKIEGTGLGLSIVKGIVEQLRGKIRVFSSEGKGTLFKIYFPISDNQGEGD